MTTCPPCNDHCTQGRTCPLQQQMHPSGMSLARWNWPFKTPEERELAARWYVRQRKSQLNNTEDALL